MGTPNKNHVDGGEMEALVANLISRYGFVVLEQNYRLGHLEVDLIAMEKDVLCFIEVKARSHRIHSGEVEDLIPQSKRDNIVQVADVYCRSLHHFFYNRIRFDYALVTVLPYKEPSVQYVRNAFTPTHWQFS